MSDGQVVPLEEVNLASSYLPQIFSGPQEIVTF